MRADALAHLLEVARGDAPADLLLTDVQVVNLYTREVERTEVALAGGHVAGLGPREALRTEPCGGRFLVPGLFDAHVHLESSMLVPRELCRVLVPRGTTAVVTDAHEIANVLGQDGIAWLLEATEGLPLDVYLMLPSCVPATPLETSGAELRAADLARWSEHPRVMGLGEVMNTPGVVGGDPAVLARLAQVHGRIDGHAVGLTGHALQAYLAAGIESDHEATTCAQGWERVRLGMHVMIREGTTERNLRALLPLLRGPAADRCMLCTDDRHPHDLLRDGGVDAVLRQAVALGADPITALAACTRQPASYLGLHRHGAITPGHVADLVLVDDLWGFRAARVWKAGRLVAADGELLVPLPPTPQEARDAVEVAHCTPDRLRIPAGEGEARVIEVIEGQILTREGRARPRIEGGEVVADPARDLLRLAVVERHGRAGTVGLGLVRGFGLRRGALASSVAHDSHNVVAVGVSRGDLHAAVQAVGRQGGGLVVVAEGEVLAAMPLPVAGLMTDLPLAEAVAALDALLAAARDLGCALADPFMTLSFLALPPVPALRLSDRGLVDATRFCHVPLFDAGPPPA